MVERPIKKADRIVRGGDVVGDDAVAVTEGAPARKTVAPVLAKDRSGDRSGDNSRSGELKAKATPSLNDGEEPRAKGRERGRDRQKRSGDDVRQTINQALARGPRPTKPKVEEPVVVSESNSGSEQPDVVEEGAES